MIDEERLNLPSASSAHRRRRCVGSDNLIGQLRTKGLLKEIPESEDAQSGTLVHRAWAGQTGLDLSRQQIQTLSEFQRLEALVVADWAGEESYTIIGREERLWLHEGITPLLSGKYDVAYRTLDWRRLVLLDGKTLFAQVQAAEYNDQLRELVALFHHNYPRIEHFRVAILSPNLAERCSLGDYDRLEAELALRLTRYTLAESQDPEAPRTPGRYCDHCPAVLQCEEARQLVGTTYSLAKRIQEGQFALPLGEKGSRVLESIITAEKLLSALKGAYKRELEASSDCLPGWRLKDGKRVRKIDDVDAAMELAMQNGFSLSEFLACTELGIGKLEERLGLLTAQSGRALANRFKEIFEGLISFKTYAPELERVKTRALPKP